MENIKINLPKKLVRPRCSHRWQIVDDLVENCVQCPIQRIKTFQEDGFYTAHYLDYQKSSPKFEAFFSS